MDKYKKQTFALLILLPFIVFIVSSLRSLDFVNNLSIGNNELSVEVNESYLVNTKDINLQNILEQTFIKTDRTMNWGFDQRIFWYKYRVSNLTSNPKEFVIYFDNPMVDYVDVYDVENQSVTLLQSFGDKMPGLESEQRAMPHLSLNISPNSSKTLIVKTQTSGAAFLPVLIFESKNFESYKNAIYLIWGAFIGIAILMSLYNLTLYTGTGDKLYLSYIGYVSFYLIANGVMYGFNPYIVGADLVTFFSDNLPAINVIICFFMISFTLRFLKLDKSVVYKSVRFARVSGYIILALVPILFYLPEYQAAIFFFPIMLYAYILAVVLMSIEFKSRFEWTKFYIISWFPLLLGSGIGSLMHAGVLEYGFWTRHAPLIGVLAEMVLISTALAERLRISEAERLYRASHDPIFDLANSDLLKRSIRDYQKSFPQSDISVITLQIQKYESIAPYLQQDDIREFVFKFIDEIEQRLSKNLRLVELDDKGSYPNVAMIREGLFSFLVTSNDPILLSETVKTVVEKQPITIKVRELTINLKFVLGLASLKSSNYSANELLERSQQSVDIAISRNTLSWTYSEKSAISDGRKMKIASDLQEAIRNDGLLLYHQPQIDLVSGKCVRSEVLLRWKHNEYGFIAPDEFVMIAEDTGIINTLTCWVVNEAFKHHTHMIKSGFENYITSINISVIDIISHSFEGFILDKLTEYKVSPEQINLEITETTSVAERALMKKKLIALKEYGFLIAIDDFGTGFSSLSYVSRLPLTELKIDREFVLDLKDSVINKNIIRATVGMAKSLGFSTVAEGIEDSESIDFLREIGCQIGQGFLIAKPMPFDKYYEWLAKRPEGCWKIK